MRKICIRDQYREEQLQKAHYSWQKGQICNGRKCVHTLQAGEKLIITLQKKKKLKA